MTIKAQPFQNFLDLTKFVNATPVAQANIAQIVHDASSGTYVLFYWS